MISDITILEPSGTLESTHFWILSSSLLDMNPLEYGLGICILNVLHVGFLYSMKYETWQYKISWRFIHTCDTNPLQKCFHLKMVVLGKQIFLHT